MPRQRDPLSIQYDRFSLRMLERARAQMYVIHFATVPSPPGDPIGAGGLTDHERAVQRSLFYVLNYSPTAGVWVKNTEESISVTWGEPETRRRSGVRGFFGPRERRRTVFVRMVPYSAAYRHVSQHPDTAYTLHSELRSVPG